MYPNTLTSMNNLAVAYSEQGRQNEAETLEKTTGGVCDIYISYHYQSTTKDSIIFSCVRGVKIVYGTPRLFTALSASAAASDDT
jgi:hypothetical protein